MTGSVGEDNITTGFIIVELDVRTEFLARRHILTHTSLSLQLLAGSLFFCAISPWAMSGGAQEASSTSSSSPKSFSL